MPLRRDSSLMKPAIIRREKAVNLEKHDVRMHVYAGAAEGVPAGIVYQETESGHAEEFLHEKSTFIYYIIEGEGLYVMAASSTMSGPGMSLSCLRATASISGDGSVRCSSRSPRGRRSTSGISGMSKWPEPLFELPRPEGRGFLLHPPPHRERVHRLCGAFHTCYTPTRF